MKPRQVVLEGHDCASEPSLQAPDLHRPAEDALVRSPYLTAQEAAAYTRRASLAAFYKWRVKYRVRAYGARGRQLFLQRDLDEALKPAGERGHRRFFASVRGGRS